MSALFFCSFDGNRFVPIGGEASDIGGTRYPVVERIYLKVAGEITEKQYETSNQYIDGWMFSMKIPENGNTSIVLTKETVIDSKTKANVSVSFNKEGVIDSTKLPYYRFQVKIQLSSIDSAGIINIFNYDFSLNFVPVTGQDFSYSERYNGKLVRRDVTIFTLKEEDEETISLKTDILTNCEGAALLISNYVIHISPIGPDESQLTGIRIHYNLKDLLTALGALNYAFTSEQILNIDFKRICSEMLGEDWGKFFLESIAVIPYFPANKKFK